MTNDRAKHSATTITSNCQNNCLKNRVIRDDPVPIEFQRLSPASPVTAIREQKEGNDVSETAIKTDEMVENRRNAIL